ncbi:MAG: carbonic anhydrase [Elusimicrobia bacterium]|nr:carbonic anhydrase [Elusimicrobiota bacterium]MBP9699380.1 carbonic anhydrase [Elusimicrobiota bacterium]
MIKLIRGIIEFRKTRRPLVMDTFARLALGQSPDCLFVACSDSRVAVNVFASTDPGDLFVIRNVGNIIPKHPNSGSTVAGLEYALKVLNVRHVIVCGHSDCGAIRALAQVPGLLPEGPLRRWLRHAEAIAQTGETSLDDLSKKNVVHQMANLFTHPVVKERVTSGTLSLHGIWFDIRKADVYYLEGDTFVLIDDSEGNKILEQLKAETPPSDNFTAKTSSPPDQSGNN